MKPHDCKFCEIAISNSENLTDIDKPIYENELFYAICSIGGFISGWTLIFPKQHTYNLSKYYTDPEFVIFVESIKFKLEKEYGKCIVFEHGALAEGLTSCGVNHAHLHIVPFLDSIEKIVQDAPDLEWQNFCSKELSQLCMDKEYLFCSDQFSANNSYGKLAILNTPQSQYFRKILANFYGIKDLYSYKTHKFEEQSLHTHKKLKKIFCDYSINES